MIYTYKEHAKPKLPSNDSEDIVGKFVNNFILQCCTHTSTISLETFLY